MMTRFYALTSSEVPGGRATIGAELGGRVYFYLANTKLWHQSDGLELHLVDGGVPEIPALEVPGRLAEVGKVDGRGLSGRCLRALKAQPPGEKRTGAELGLRTQPGDRPVAGGGLRALLEDLPIGERRMIARYDADRKAVAQNLAYEINSRLKKSLAGLEVSAGASVEEVDVVVTIQREAPPAQPARGRAGQMLPA
ncbi:hypothetical protein [Brachybacterium kimchii]|uniref:Uncharacterized protein n=1 Tax=Brachybacterium kimchii TaxID=2942909 RepID=A0ABY4NB69_9MICO|nr:hypothetical protein [Brachybacterium kimchii]UQN31799.1 hypothetical protein M4486_19610 [Brachybacterium kimchii]